MTGIVTVHKLIGLTGAGEDENPWTAYCSQCQRTTLFLRSQGYGTWRHAFDWSRLHAKAHSDVHLTPGVVEMFRNFGNNQQYVDACARISRDFDMKRPRDVEQCMAAWQHLIDQDCLNEPHSATLRNAIARGRRVLLGRAAAR